MSKLDEWIKSTKKWKTRIHPYLNRKIREGEDKIARLEARKGNNGDSSGEGER